MSKSASQVSQKYADRSSAATGDFIQGAQSTSKDQAAAAIAASAIYAQATQAAITSGSYAKGLQRSGKAGWLKGITEKGANRYGEGVSAAAPKYAENSGAFDSARNAAASAPRGIKGSPQNLARVATVVKALMDAKKNR